MKGKRRNPKDPPAEYRWKPGQSGNPGGKPAGEKNLSTVLRELMAMSDEELVKFSQRTDLTQRDRIALGWLRRSDSDSTGHLGMALDRTEGSVKQVHEHQGAVPVGDPLDLAKKLSKDSAKGSPGGTED